jgi:hypothetical protein
MSVTSIEIKVLSFDEFSQSVICAFRETGNDTPFENFRTYAYQPSMFNTDSLDHFIKEVARSGVSIVESQLKEKEVAENTEFINKLKNSVGTVAQFNVSDLYVEPSEDLSMQQFET